MASSFRTQKQHGRGDDAHWVFTLSGLISGPYYGRFFPPPWFQRQYCLQLRDVT